MKALSIKPPWAYLIIWGYPLTETVENPNGSTSVRLSGKALLKNIENRSWPLPKGFEVPQRIYIHVGKREDNGAWLRLVNKGFAMFTSLLLSSPALPRGAIIGEVDIIGCVTESESPWFAGPYGFQLANPKAYEKPIPYKGKLGFFEVAQ